MRHSSDNAGNPQKWLDVAKADMAIASIQLPSGGMYEQLCFHAQQAAEKSIKAVLLHLDIDFPFTHNLQLLLDLLPPEIAVADEVNNVIELNAYAVPARYPGELEPAAKEDYKRALLIAGATLEWAESIILEPSSASNKTGCWPI